MFRFYSLFLLGIFPSGFFEIEVDAANCNKTDDLWQCTSGACIKIQQVCDGIKHCRDGSDETKKLCSDMKCSSLSFQCKYGACISILQVCDGVPDCEDSSDEDINYCRQRRDNLPDDDVDDETSRRNCVGWGQMKCWSGQCVNINDRCNGIRDCADGSDETELLCNALSCTMKQFRCGYGACIPSTAKCNGIRECWDGTDELENLCIEDDATGATISVTSTISTSDTTVLSEKKTFTVTDTNSSDLIDEKFISESSTKLVDTKNLSTILAQRENNQNTKSSSDGVTQQNVQPSVKEVNIELKFPLLSINSTQPSLHLANISTESSEATENFKPTSILVQSYTKATKFNLSSAHQPAVTMLMDENSYSQESLLKPLIARGEVITTTPPTPTTTILKTILQDGNNAYNDPKTYKPQDHPTDRTLYSTNQMPPKFNQAHSSPRTQLATTTPKVETTDVAKSNCMQSDTDYPSKCVLATPPEINPEGSINSYDSTTLVEGSEGTFSFADAKECTSTAENFSLAPAYCEVDFLSACISPLVCYYSQPNNNTTIKISQHFHDKMVGEHSKINFYCDRGYQLQGSKSRECKVNVWNAEIPRCASDYHFLSACGSSIICLFYDKNLQTWIPAQDNIDRITKDTVFYFYCKKGYESDGSSRTQFTAEGGREKIPTCRKITSPCEINLSSNNPMIYKRYNLSNSQFSNEQKHFAENEQIKFSCKGDYLLDGRELLTCKKGGWDNPIPKCLPSCKGNLIPKCESPLKCTLHHSSLDLYQKITNRNRPKYILYPQATEVTFWCADSYKLQGGNRTICGKNGWSHEQRMMVPKCSSPCDNKIFERCKRPLQCNYHNTKKWIKIQGNYMESMVSLGSIIDIINPQTYIQRGVTRIKCTTNGWVNTSN